MSDQAADLRKVLEKQPLLGTFGFGVFDRAHKSPEERRAALRKSRAEMMEPEYLAQFEAARGWIRRFRKLKTVNRRRSSYGLKHVAEKQVGRYLANGVVIAAAIAEGFDVVIDEPNAYFNLPAEAWREAQS